MIDFFFEFEDGAFDLKGFADWITRVIISEDFQIGPLSFIFCEDNYLLEINRKYLDHDNLTDIITFNYVDGRLIGGDVYISLERVRENAVLYKVDFLEELKRVMAHGVLHLCGYDDKTEEDISIMRLKEEEKIKLFHVEQRRDV